MAQGNSSHGKRKPRHWLSTKYPAEYNAWRRMKKCCYNPGNPAYQYYGGRGIGVCQGWRDSFPRFLASMGPRPDSKLTLDRIDNERGYDCGDCDDCRARNASLNCRWATRWQQVMNRRLRGKEYEFDGKRLRIVEWEAITGLYRRTIARRIELLGWSVEKALTTPSRFPGPRKKRNPPPQ